MAGLALGVSSLGVCYEIAFGFNGWAQIVAALIATGLLTLLLGRYLLHFDTLIADLKHPVLGSIAPTFAMCLMVLSKTLGVFSHSRCHPLVDGRDYSRIDSVCFHSSSIK